MDKKSDRVIRNVLKFEHVEYMSIELLEGNHTRNIASVPYIRVDLGFYSFKKKPFSGLK